MPRASILRALANPMATFFCSGSDFGENTEIIQKPRFSYGFSMISGDRRASKSLKNLKKSTPECLGRPKSRPGWAGLARLAAQVANVGPMGVQWRRFPAQMDVWKGGVPALTREHLLGTRPRGRVGKGHRDWDRRLDCYLYTP